MPREGPRYIRDWTEKRLKDFILQNAGGAGITDGNKGDITVSLAGANWQVNAGAIGTAELGGDITAAGKALLDDADNVAQRATLGLGTAATFASSAFATASHTHAASAITSGTIDTARLGSGTANSSSFLRGDQTWASVIAPGVPDGDYGDIVVSLDGDSWQIKSGVVTTAELGGDITTAGKNLLDDANAAAQRTTLGLGTIATQSPTGTPDGTKFLRDDYTWQAPPGGGSGITQLTGDVTAGPGSGSQVATIPNSTITYARIQNVSAGLRVLGRASGAGVVEELILGTGLGVTGSTINVTGLSDGDRVDINVTGSGATWTIKNEAVTLAKFRHTNQQRVIGRISGFGACEEVQATQILDWIGSTRGQILYRDASNWAVLSPGTSGQFLQTQGAGANPQWATPAPPAGQWTKVTKPSDTNRINTTTSTNDPDLQFTATANTNYNIRGCIWYNTNANGDFRIQLAGPGSPDHVRVTWYRILPTRTVFVTSVANGYSSDVTLIDTTGGNGYVEFEAVVDLGASGGTIAIAWAQGTLDAVNNTTVLRGSYIEYTTFT